MTGQQLLQKDKPLAQWWAGVKEDPRFELVIGHLKAELFETNPNANAVQAIELLARITDNPVVSPKPVQSGLMHDFPTRKTT
jgi:hypothetical protein